MKGEHEMTPNQSRVFYFNVQRPDGRVTVWHVYADRKKEAEQTAVWMCRLFGAVYLGEITGGRICTL